MGAVRMRVQTADKKHHNNPHHSNPSSNVLGSLGIISLKEALSWIMDQKQQYEVKNRLMMDLFLSAVWTLILTAPIHCGGSFGE